MTAYSISSGSVFSGVLDCNIAWINKGGTASSVFVNSGGELYVSSGGAARDTVVEYGGLMKVSSGAIASGTTVESGGRLYVSYGGTADNTLLTSGGIINGFSFTENKYIDFTLSGAVVAPDVNILTSYLTVFSGGYLSNTTVYANSYIMVKSGGNAENITVNSGAMLNDFSFDGDRVFEKIYNGSVNLSHGVIISGSRMDILQGGTASKITVNFDASIHVSSGGKAVNTNVYNLGSMYISNGGVADDAVVSRGVLTICGGGVASNTKLESSYFDNNYLYVSGGGIAYNTDIHMGRVFVSCGGVISNTVVNSHSKIFVSSGGVAVSTILNWNGSMCISSGGFAENTIVNSEGRIYISSGGTASIAYNPWIGRIIASSGAVVTYLERDACVYYGDRTYGLLSKCNAADGLIIDSFNSAIIYSGGTACNTTMMVLGYLYISSGGVHRGTLRNSAGFVSAYSGAVIDFTVSEMSSSDDYLINNLSWIKGAPTYTITVSANQSNGVYKLAQGAANFNKTITVGDGTVDYGTLSANGSVLEYNGATYQLMLDSGNLTLKIEGNTTEFCASNLLSNGTSQIVAWDKEKGAVGFVATDGNESPAWRGVWDWDGADVDLWRVVGVGHFAGSQVDHDGILLYNGIGTTFAAWTNLNSGDYGYVDLCHVEGNFNTKTLTDLDGDEYDDVLICDEKGSFGVVLDGASYQDIWHAEDAAANPWQLKGAGKFGGTEEKLIVQNTSGHLYLWTNNDKTFSTWNWSQEAIGYLGNEWEFITSGDFAGDGTDDIIVRNLSDGGLWVWDDGKENTAHWVGTPGDGFKVEAVGDYNGDGKEDLLLREYTTGWGGVGYWASADASQWHDLNARIETDLESKFSVIA